MLRINWHFVLVISCVSLGGASGCAQDKKPPSSPAVYEIEEDPSVQVKKLEERIEGLESQLAILEINRTQYHKATFDPTNNSYQRVDAPQGFGSFAVAVEDVRALGDGVRVLVKFGNLSSASFGDVKVSMKYGPREPKLDAPEWATKYRAWQQSLQEKEVALTQQLMAGSWNKLPVTLPGIAAGEFGYLELSLNTNTIYLTERAAQ